MPSFSYWCEHEKRKFHIRHGINNDLKVCPRCDHKVEKIFDGGTPSNPKRTAGIKFNCGGTTVNGRF